MVLHSLRLMESNLFVRATGFWNPGNFGLWNSESGKKVLVESGIQLEESVFPLKHLEARILVSLTKTGIQYLELGIHRMESRIQDPLGFPYMGRILCLSFTNRPFVLKGQVTTFL